MPKYMNLIMPHRFIGWTELLAKCFAFHFKRRDSFVVMFAMTLAFIARAKPKRKKKTKRLYMVKPIFTMCKICMALDNLPGSTLLVWKTMKRLHIVAENRACMLVKPRKLTKYLMFLRPTQVPIHGQWWS